MGARGPTPKPAARRQRRNKMTEAKLRLVEPGAAPPADEAPVEKPAPLPAPARREWLASTKTRWGVYWGSRLAQLVDVASDLPALERLFDLYDERERAQRAFRKQRVVKGSMGQPVLNPMGKMIKELDPEIRMLEDRFGLTPAARLRMHVGEEDDPGGDLDRLNAALMSDDGEDDPRAG